MNKTDGVKKIKNYITSCNLDYIEDFKIKDNVGRNISFDFYLPYTNQCLKFYTAKPITKTPLVELNDLCKNNDKEFLPVFVDDLKRLNLIIRQSNENELNYMINQIILEGRVLRIVHENESICRFDISQERGLRHEIYSICCFNPEMFNTIKNNLNRIIIIKGKFRRNDYYDKKQKRFINSYTITCEDIDTEI